MIELYTVGGGSNLVAMLNAVAAFVNSAVMEQMMQIAIVGSVIVFGFKAASGAGLGDAGKWAAVVCVVWLGFVENKSTVLVVDRTNPFLVGAAVDNVPWALAAFAGYSSQAGAAISDRYTALTSTPQAVSYQRNGFVFGSTLLSQATRYRIVEDRLSLSLTNFLEQCVLYASLLNHVNFEVIANADDLAGAIGGDLVSSLSYLEFGTDDAGADVTTTVACADGFAGLVERVNEDVERVLLKEAVGRYPSPEFTDAVKVSRFVEDLEGFQSYMIGSAVEARDRIRQMMFVTALDDSINRFIASSGNDATMEYYSAARAEAQTITSYNATGAGALKWVPLLKAAFETVYVALFPLAAFLLVTPLWMVVLKGYFGGFIWLTSWEAISVVLHNIVLAQSSDYYTGAATFVNSAGAREAVMSWANHLGIRSVEGDISTVAGYLMSLAPFLAFGIFFGASRMQGLATGFLNVGQGAAIEAGREASTGNLSLANTSMDIHSANSLSTSSMVDRGRATSFLPSGDSATINADGSSSMAAGSALTTGGVGLGLGNQLGESFRLAAQTSQRAVETSAQSVSEGYSAAIREVSSLMDRHGSNTSVGSSTGTSDSVRSSGSLSSALSNVEQFAERHGVEQATAIRAALDAGLGISSGTGLGPKAGVGGTAEIQGRDTDSYHSLVQAAQNENLGRELVSAVEGNQSESGSVTGSHGYDAQSGASASLDKLSSAVSTHSSAVERAETLSRAAETFSSSSASDNTQLATAFMNYLGSEQGMTMSEISPIMNPKTTSEVAQSQAHVGAFMQHVASEYGIGAEASSAFAEGISSVGVPNSGPLGGARGAAAELAVQDGFQIGAMAIEQDGINRGDAPMDIDQEYARISRSASATQEEVSAGMAAGEPGVRDNNSSVQESVEEMQDNTTGGTFLDKASKAVGLK